MFIVPTPPPPPPFLHKEGMRFFKMAVMGGWEIFTRNGGKPGMGVAFIIGRWKIFEVSLHSW